MRYRYILWDWNGTVLDDLSASFEAVNDMLDLYKKDRIDMSQYYSYVDTPIYKFYEHIFDLSVVGMDVIKLLFRDFYNRRSNEIRLSEGAYDAIDACRALGMRQYLLSAENVDTLTEYAKRLGIFEKFDGIEAASDHDAGSKIERAKKLMKSQGIDPGKCVLVGDTLHDFETAKALGTECVLYSGGHTDALKLKKTGKTVCSSFAEILREVTKD